MCLACEMESEFWNAYLDHLAEQAKAEAADASKPPAGSAPKAVAAPAFVCEEPPSE